MFRVWILGSGGHSLHRASGLVAHFWGAGDGTEAWHSGLGTKRDDRVIVLDFCTPPRSLERCFPQTLGLHILTVRGRENGVERRGYYMERSEEEPEEATCCFLLSLNKHCFSHWLTSPQSFSLVTLLYSSLSSSMHQHWVIQDRITKHNFPTLNGKILAWLLKVLLNSPSSPWYQEP